MLFLVAPLLHLLVSMKFVFFCFHLLSSFLPLGSFNDNTYCQGALSFFFGVTTTKLHCMQITPSLQAVCFYKVKDRIRGKPNIV